MRRRPLGRRPVTRWLESLRDHRKVFGAGCGTHLTVEARDPREGQERADSARHGRGGSGRRPFDGGRPPTPTASVLAEAEGKRGATSGQERPRNSERRPYRWAKRPRARPPRTSPPCPSRLLSCAGASLPMATPPVSWATPRACAWSDRQRLARGRERRRSMWRASYRPRRQRQKRGPKVLAGGGIDRGCWGAPRGWGRAPRRRHADRGHHEAQPGCLMRSASDHPTRARVRGRSPSRPLA